ncbi:MAG TPA: glutamyl-tRNA reductase [Homoserinimonas sp.]|nr:glutamyl-tRNA reductase [Homoserinimonas sp.]
MLVCFTANHHLSSFDILESLAAHDSGGTETVLRGMAGVNGAVVLSTCNRFEAYLDVADTVTLDELTSNVIETLSKSTGVPTSALANSIGTLQDTEVAPHLFGVSAGLKSVVIGEDEIAGQVRRALEQARATGGASSGLERLFQAASRASKTVKSTTAVGRADRSLVRLGLELAASRIADWAETRVLLIGTGQYAATTVAALRDRGAEDIIVYSPSGRAAQFAARLSLSAAESLSAAAADADLVIACTSREQPVLTTAELTPGRRRLVIDLGLPRNVSPEVATLAGIELLDLETIRLHAPLEELSATEDAHAVVDDAVTTFSTAEAERGTAAAIVALRKQVLATLDAELERARARGTWNAQSEAALRHFAGVLLHGPSTRARELARTGRSDEFVSGLAAVFGIEPHGAAASGPASDDSEADELLA